MMDRRGFLGAFVAFACSPAFPAPSLTYKGVPLVFTGYIGGLQALVDSMPGASLLGIERSTYRWWWREDGVVPESEIREAMEKAWQECIR